MQENIASHDTKLHLNNMNLNETQRQMEMALWQAKGPKF